MGSAVIAKAGLSETALADQTVVVTGGGRGIGREAALACAWLGARVVIAELSEAGRETERAIIKAGGQACFVQTDVADEASVAAMVAQARQAFGPVDVLINNAAVVPFAPVIEMDLATWRRAIGANLDGTFLTCRACLPDMLGRGRGVIVNFTSLEGAPGMAAYIASKMGIAGFTQSLAMEVGEQGVRVIDFGPGTVDTPGFRSIAQSLAPRLGFSAEEFLSTSIHPAYEGLMPAEHAGAAVAYLVAVLADAYHGEAVSGYTILEQAGIIQPLAAEAPASRPEHWALAEQDASDRVGDIRQALELTVKLQELIATTEKEFEKLPIIFRPMARGGFKNKSGKSFQDWKRLLAGWVEGLDAGQSGKPDAGLTGKPDAGLSGKPEAVKRLRAERGQLIELLDKLVGYYEGVPAETARFTKDPVFMQEVRETACERVALVQALRASLERW